MGCACEKIEESSGSAEQCLGELLGLAGSLDAATMSESDLERQLAERSRELMREILDEHLLMRAPGKTLGPVRETGGEERSEARQHQRKLLSLFGPVTVDRAGYARSGEESLHPLDGELNLPRELYSLELQRQACLEVVRGSYEETQEAVERHTGIKIPKRQIEEIATRGGVDFQAFYEAREREEKGQRTPARDVAPLMVLSFDGKGIVVRKEDLRAATRRKAKGKKSGKTGRKRMATVATVYEVSRFERTPQEVVDRLWPAGPKPPGGKRPKPQAKRVWASLERDSREVMAEAFAEAASRDPDGRLEWVVLVDGDPHQLRLLRSFQKSYPFSINLDFFHVLEYLWAAVKVLCPGDDWEQTSYVRERAIRILSGWSSEVAGTLRAAATRKGLQDEDRKTVDTACDYLLKYKKFLGYDEALEGGRPIGTGVIEGTCKSLIVHRMERTGARWSLAGAEAVLKLRALAQSGDFDEYWRFHEKQEHLRVHRSKYADGVVPETTKERFSQPPNLTVVK